MQPFPLSRLQKFLFQACYIIILCQVSVLCVYCTMVFSQRYHLFVWSVFSPKLLYESTKTLLCTLSVATVLCLMHFVTRVPRMDFEKTEWKQRTYFGWTRTNQQFRIISLRYVAHEKKYKCMEERIRWKPRLIPVFGVICGLLLSGFPRLWDLFPLCNTTAPNQ